MQLVHVPQARQRGLRLRSHAYLLLVRCADFRPCAVIVRESALLSESGGGFVGTAPFTFVCAVSDLLAGLGQLHLLPGLQGLRVEVVRLDDQLAPVVEQSSPRARSLGEVRQLDRLGVVDRHLGAAGVGVSRALRAAAESEGAEYGGQDHGCCGEPGLAGGGGLGLQGALLSERARCSPGSSRVA